MRKITLFTATLVIASLIMAGCNTRSLPKAEIEEVEQIQAEMQVVEEPKEKERDVASVDIGEKAEMSDITFTVNSYEEMKSISGRYSSRAETANEGAKFVVIDIDVTNEGGTDLTFFPNQYFRLVDVINEREYTTFDRSIGNVENYLEVRKLSAGIKENGKIVYQVPEESTNYGLLGFDDAINKSFYVVLNVTSEIENKE